MASSVFDLFARLTLDSRDFDNQLRGSESKFGAFGNKLKSFAGTAIKVTSAAVAAGAGVVAAITKSAISGYADYEQLVGGVETLFKDSAERVIENSQNAYRTAGMSANEYMETVTGFSASLLQSLEGDTQKASEMADLAVQDMSDNANKMGTDMERITDAYQGFAKQNYTMLDNLKLGYGGTKTEMERLVADAEKLDSSFQATRDENGKLTLSFSDVVQAIHIVQNKMGITGTTAKEASTTISGSISSMKAAWQNLLTGIADDNANFAQLVDNFINTLIGEGGQGGVINNLIPRIQQTLQGITKFITVASEQLLPIIVSTIITNLPALIQAGLQIVTTLSGAIIDNLPSLIDAAIQIIQMITSTIITPDNLVALIDAGLQILLALADALIDALPEMIPAIVQIIITIVEKLTEPKTLAKLVLAAVEIIIALANGLIQAIPQLLEAIPQIISNLVGAIIANLPTILSAGVQILVSLVTGILGALPQLIALAPELLAALAGGIVQGIKTIVDIGKQVVDGFLKGVSDAWNGMVNNVKKFFTGFIDVIKGLFGIHSPSTVFAKIGEFLIAGFTKGISDKVSEITKQIQTLKESITNIFQNLADAAASWGRDLIGNFVSGLQEKLQALKDKAVSIAQQIKDVIGFSEPKEGPLSNFHTFAPDMMQLWAKGIKDNEHLVTDAITNAADFGGAVTAAGFSSGTVVGTGGGRSIAAGPRMQTIILQVGRTELARLVHELNGEEDERIGLKLVTA